MVREAIGTARETLEQVLLCLSRHGHWLIHGRCRNDSVPCTTWEHASIVNLPPLPAIRGAIIPQPRFKRGL